MRYACSTCGKCVTTELPNDSVIRAILVCPECIEWRKVIIPEPKPPTRNMEPNKN